MCDVRCAFDAVLKAASFYQTLSCTHQREYMKWITEAKRPDTRIRRTQKAINMMLEGKKGR